MTYIGRFAPSPTGPLHLGSIVAAAASFLDARSHEGQWLVRIEDLDTERCDPGAARLILETLQKLGMKPDRPVLYQSSRLTQYQGALDALDDAGVIYDCGCKRAQVRAQAPSPGIYAGTCRSGLPAGAQPRTKRFRIDAADDVFFDRLAGSQRSLRGEQFGDPVVRRADGSFAYVLAGAIDDVTTGVTDVVRGDDLLPTTATQRLLLDKLGHAAPRYAHVPVVCGPDGRKLSKQNHAPAVDTTRPVDVVTRAFDALGLSSLMTYPASRTTLNEVWTMGTAAWTQMLVDRSTEPSAAG